MKNKKYTWRISLLFTLGGLLLLFITFNRIQRASGDITLLLKDGVTYLVVFLFWVLFGVLPFRFFVGNENAFFAFGSLIILIMVVMSVSGFVKTVPQADLVYGLFGCGLCFLAACYLKKKKKLANSELG